MKLLRGDKIADGILAKIKVNIKKEKIRPSLSVILVGKDKASRIYVALKKKAAQKVGINFYLHKFKETEKEEKIIQKIKDLNQDNKINGIIVQLPLPEKFHAQKIIGAIDPRKDVDGFSARSLSQPVFPKAIMVMLANSKKKLRSKKALVISNSNIFGETMLATLKKQDISGTYILVRKLPQNIKNISSSIQAIFPKNKVSTVKRKKNCLDISCYSNKLESLLGWKVGLGSKEKQKVSIPKWIKRNREYTLSCLKGLFETDGSVYMDRKYKMANFVTIIPPLANDVMEMTSNLGFKPNMQIFKEKNGKSKHTIRISKNTEKFIKLVGINKN